jgi:vacuolar iron transporter family protein
MDPVKALHEKNNSAPAMLRDVVTGMSDGLTIPFALAAGLTVVVDSTAIIVIAGIAEIASGSIAMALGGYFSVKSEQEDHQARLQKEYSDLSAGETKESVSTKEFFANLGLSEEIQLQASEEIAKDKDKWLAFMAKYETSQDRQRLTSSAWNIGLSYIAGGLVPLTPYFLMQDPSEALKYATIITLLCLFILGWFKGKITGINAIGSAIRITLISAAAAAAAYGVARIFEVA